MKKKAITIHLSEDDYEILKNKANKDYRTIKGEVEKTIMDRLKVISNPYNATIVSPYPVFHNNNRFKEESEEK